MYVYDRIKFLKRHRLRTFDDGDVVTCVRVLIIIGDYLTRHKKLFISTVYDDKNLIGVVRWDSNLRTPAY